MNRYSVLSPSSTSIWWRHTESRRSRANSAAGTSNIPPSTSPRRMSATALSTVTPSRSTNVSSRAGSPHQFGLRTSTTRWRGTNRATMNGPVATVCCVNVPGYFSATSRGTGAVNVMDNS